MRRIHHVEILPDHVLALRDSTGHTVRYDVKPLLDEGGVWTSLRDPKVFQQVSIGGGGRFVTWPGDLDLCADAIWLEAEREQQRV